MTESEMYLAKYATESGLPIWTAAGQVIDNLHARLLTERGKALEEAALRCDALMRIDNYTSPMVCATEIRRLK